MNLPNKMTLLRIILIPVFMVVLYWGFPGATWVALAIFIIASLTDMLDGKIARKYNLVTDFGKFADPLADKMLVTAAMLWFVEIGQMPAWMLLIVICREFAVSGLLARSQLASGQPADARRTIEVLREYFAERGLTRFLPNMDAMLCRIDIRQ